MSDGKKWYWSGEIKTCDPLLMQLYDEPPTYWRTRGIELAIFTLDELKAHDEKVAREAFYFGTTMQERDPHGFEEAFNNWWKEKNEKSKT